MGLLSSGLAATGIFEDRPQASRRLAISRFSRWTIGARTTALVLTLAVPLNLLIFGVVWHLAESASEAQRTSLLYTARSVAAAVDAELGKDLALAEVLAHSPALLNDNLDDFEAEARRAFVSTADAWVVVADPEGRQLFNTARPRGERLPIRNPVGLAAQRQALETRSIIISDVQLGTVSHAWIIDIEVPVFRGGQPFRVLSVTRKAESFLRLLNDGDIPKNWLAAIIDSQGRYIARVPGNEQNVAQLTSESWRKEMHHQNGVFERFSSDGDPIIAAQAHSSVSGWLVGIAVKKAEVQSAVWSTIRWAAIFGGGLSFLSLLLARALSRHITGPIAEIREKAAALLTGAASQEPVGPPEIGDLWHTLKQSAADRNRSDQALRESEERFRATFENAAVGVAHVAPDGSFLLVNRCLCQILGYTAEEIHAKSFQDITLPDDIEAGLAQFRRMLNVEIDSFAMEKRYLRKDGSIIWARLTVGAVLKADSAVDYIISVVEDISEQKRAEVALRENEERFRGVYEHAGTGIAITDMHGRFESCNPAYSAMLGYSEDELRRLTFSELVYPEDWDMNLAQYRRLISQEIPSFDIVNRYVGKDGKLIWAHKHVYLLRDAHGCPTNTIGLAADITERKRHEEKIHESEKRLLVALDTAQRAEEELSEVLGSTVEKQEAERQRVARELHDTLGQTLTLLKLGFDELGRALPADKDVHSKLTALKALVDGVGSDVNRLAWEIRPAALDDLGLETAIRQLVETWSERSNLQFGLHLTLNDRRMDAAVETTLYRVLQETITNIAKHANATRAGVLLEASAKEVRMIVEDDGRGFSAEDTAPAGVASKRLGLLGIRERLSLVRGTLEVESEPGRGCTLFVRVPL